jgi:hypothetical protein
MVGDWDVKSAQDRPRLTLIRPARKDERQPRPFPNWLRQRVEAIIWTLFPNASDFSPHQARVNARIRNCPP